MKIKNAMLLDIERILIYFLPVHIQGTRFPIKDYDDSWWMSVENNSQITAILQTTNLPDDSQVRHK